MNKVNKEMDNDFSFTLDFQKIGPSVNKDKLVLTIKDNDPERFALVEVTLNWHSLEKLALSRFFQRENKKAAERFAAGENVCVEFGGEFDLGFLTVFSISRSDRDILLQLHDEHGSETGIFRFEARKFHKIFGEIITALRKRICGRI